MSEYLPITGFEVRSFRSFGPEGQRLGPCKKVNVIIGQNNSGKSNILRFIKSAVQPFYAREESKFGSIDNPVGLPNDNDAASILLNIDTDHLIGSLKISRDLAVHLQDFLGRLRPVGEGKRYVWAPILTFRRNAVINYDKWINDIGLQQTPDVKYIWGMLTGSSDGGFREHWFPEIIQHVWSAQRQPFDLVSIPAIRRIDSRLTEFAEEYGNAKSDDKIIDDLAALAEPSYKNTADREKFLKIQEFVRKVLNRSDLTIAVPHDHNTINIKMDGRVLPLEALGTGIHQIVIMAARAVVVSRSVVTIEEPELHFHPELQKQFMRFLFEDTDNQYFITTHSAHVMDAVDSSVFSTSAEKGMTIIRSALTSSNRRSICQALGYRPSDLLQSNCIIWVEGPSDRIYINLWIQSLDQNLVEGIDYSIMFYGGRLLSNLSADEEAVKDFIQILPINRFSAIVIDSDKRTSRSRINATKQRIKTEFENMHGYVWITKGREIENYIPSSALIEGVRSAHPLADALEFPDQPFQSALDYRDQAGKVHEGKFDKIAIARAVAGRGPTLDQLDIRERVCGLVEFVRKANRIAHPFPWER